MSKMAKDREQVVTPLAKVHWAKQDNDTLQRIRLLPH